MAIDYELQFKTVDWDTVVQFTSTWQRHRTYDTAKAAFQSAVRTEARGIDVAFAKDDRFGEFHVWTGNEHAEAKCSHKGDYNVSYVDIDQHPVTTCANCGERVEL